MKAKIFAFGLMLASVLSAPAVLAVSYDELTPAQKAAIGKGELVSVTRDVAGKPWPAVWVFLRIESTPEEGMAVFADADRQKEYLPNLKKSKVSKKINKNTFQCDYTLDLPFPLGDENYTVENVLSSKAAAYKMAWKLVRADTTKEIDGYSEFRELGTGTLLTYYNFVVPGSGLAGAVKSQAEKQVRDVAFELRKRVEWQRKSNPDLLRQQIEALNAALE